ncbi:MAG: phage integrase SAM-like domain-containing protein, partial [Spirosoma sp.]|nr:phage integrase SAM-like domain-containing protein [Spirosoma sp.]
MARTTEFKEGKATVRAIYRTVKTLADESHPFWIRITKGRESKFIATGLSLHPKFWNDKYTNYREAIRKTYPFRANLINTLEQWETKYSSAAETLADTDEVHNARAIASQVSSERQATRKFRLLEYFDELISQFEKAGKVGNRKVYRDIQNNLRRFLGEGQDVAFSAITVKFCNEWETKMRAEGLTEITLSVKFRTLRAVLNKAIANGYAKPTNYP